MKKLTPYFLVLALIVNIFNFGSYDPQNELGSLNPGLALATSTFGTSGLETPSLETPKLSADNFGEIEQSSFSSNMSFSGGTTLNLLKQESSNSSSQSSHSYHSDKFVGTCNISANVEQVSFGSDVVISWSTAGFSNVTINGVSVSNSGTKTFYNIEENTTYTLVAKSENGKSNCTSAIVVKCLPKPPVPPAPRTPICTLTPVTKTIYSGETVDLVWTTTNSSNVTLTNFGDVDLNGTKNTGALTESKEYILEVLGFNDDTVTCSSKITVKPKPTPVPTCDLFTVTPNSIVRGNSSELVWKTSNATRVAINNGIGEVEATGKLSVKPLATTEYVMTVFGANNKKATCKQTLTVTEPPVVKVPMCLTFNATPFALPFGGGQSEIKWTTENATKVVISGIGEVTVNGSKTVNISETTTYTLIASDSKKKHSCFVTIDVEPELPPPTPPPTCTLTPATKSITSGESVDLVWTTTNATNAYLTDFDSVELNGTKNTGALTEGKEYTLEVLGMNDEAITCTSKISLSTLPPTPTPISCSANVSLSANPSSITRGNSTTITWSTTNITGLSFDNGINSTSTSGSATVSPTSNTTYSLTATDGKDTIVCPLPVTVNNPPTTTGGGGGGGGSSAPTCELNISDRKIKRGEDIRLNWDSNRATDLTIIDGTGKVLVTTKNKLSRDKDELFRGAMTLIPTANTTYTMTVERGSQDRVCTASVEIEGSTVVVTQIRDQQPLIASISLVDVPYTGFEAGPILTVLFYTLLMLWALYIAYLWVIRRNPNGDFQLAMPENIVASNIKTVGEVIRPDVFVAKVQVPERNLETIVPANLPVGNPVVGYASQDDTKAQVTANLHSVDDEAATQIENYAHSQHVLLSSDAIRHFVATTNNSEERVMALNQIMAASKAQFPAEDGWIVINEKRMRDLCEVCSVNQISANDVPYIPTVIPEGAGSLAEAIVTGNIVAAYELIGHRPMFALADVAADLDSVYRVRRGGKEVISDLLIKETEKLTDEQLVAMIGALTGALDGTYNDEASAVKMAIMKAVKVVA